MGQQHTVQAQTLPQVPSKSPIISVTQNESDEKSKIEDYTFSEANLTTSVDKEQNTLPEIDPMTTQEMDNLNNYYRKTIHQPNIDRVMNQEPTELTMISSDDQSSSAKSENTKNLTKSSGHSSKEGRNKFGLSLNLNPKSENTSQESQNSDSTIKNVNSSSNTRNESSIDSDYICGSMEKSQIPINYQELDDTQDQTLNLDESDKNVSAFSIKNLTRISDCDRNYYVSNNSRNNTVDSLTQSQIFSEPRHSSTMVEDNSCSSSLYNLEFSVTSGSCNGALPRGLPNEPPSAGYGSAGPSPIDVDDYKQQVMGLSGQLGRKGHTGNSRFNFEANIQLGM